MTKKATNYIVKQIKTEMKKREMTVKDLSKRANVALSTLYDIFDGRCSPRMITVIMVCEALDMELVLLSRADKEEYKVVE